jgi:hypothetical protein
MQLPSQAMTIQEAQQHQQRPANASNARLRDKKRRQHQSLQLLTQ